MHHEECSPHHALTHFRTTTAKTARTATAASSLAASEHGEKIENDDGGGRKKALLASSWNVVSRREIAPWFPVGEDLPKANGLIGSSRFPTALESMILTISAIVANKTGH